MFTLTCTTGAVKNIWKRKNGILTDDELEEINGKLIFEKDVE